MNDHTLTFLPLHYRLLANWYHSSQLCYRSGKKNSKSVGLQTCYERLVPKKPAVSSNCYFAPRQPSDDTSKSVSHPSSVPNPDVGLSIIVSIT